jgi:hypothetical protein
MIAHTKMRRIGLLAVPKETSTTKAKPISIAKIMVLMDMRGFQIKERRADRVV